MKHEVLSLDFWQKTTIYGDKNFPCGTIGCDALNVPAEVLDKLGIYCSLLNALLGTFNAGCGDPALLPAARESVKQMAELLKDVKPFSYVELPNAAERIERVFSEESLVNANAIPLESQLVLKGMPTKEKWFVGIHSKTIKSTELHPDGR